MIFRFAEFFPIFSRHSFQSHLFGVNKLKYLDKKIHLQVLNDNYEFICAQVQKAFTVHKLFPEEADFENKLKVFLKKFITDFGNPSPENDYDKITMSNDITVIFDIDLSRKNEFYMQITYKPETHEEQFLCLISITYDKSMLRGYIME